MNTYNDLKKSKREELEKHLANFSGKIEQIPIGVSGEIPFHQKDATETKKKLQQQERNARKAVKIKKKYTKSETMKVVIGHSRGNDGYMLFLKCGHQKQSAVKDAGKIPLTSKCFTCLKEKAH